MILTDIYNHKLKITKKDVFNFVKSKNDYYIIKNKQKLTNALYEKIKKFTYAINESLFFYTDIEENKKRFLKNIFNDYNEPI